MGENRAREAASAAVNSPLLDVSIHGAKGVLFAIYGADDLGMLEVQEAAKIITESVDKDAKIIFGIASDPTLKKDEVKVTVIATGFPTGFSTRGHSSPGMIHNDPKIDEIIAPEPKVEKKESIKEAIDDAKDGIIGNDKRIDNDIKGRGGFESPSNGRSTKDSI
jgi:cell division GTPase FtsZ